MASPDEIRRIVEVEKCACVFIDDTGSQGQKQNLPHLPDDRFTWAGIIIPPRLGGQVFHYMDELLGKGQNKYGIDEFHFVEIFGGKNNWQNVDVKERLNIFRVFADFIGQKKFEIASATLEDADDHLDNKFPRSLIIKGKDMKDPKILSLYILLRRVAEILDKLEWTNTLVVIDEGIQKKQSLIKCNKFPSSFRKGEIHFASSREVTPLQLADFAAYSLNRMQIVCAKYIENSRSLGFIDFGFMDATGPIVSLYKNTIRHDIKVKISRKRTKL